MKIALLLTIYLRFIHNSGAENYCNSGWLAYENEKCVKLFTDVETHETASNICANQSFSATLVSIRSKKEQEFLENYVFNQSNSVDSVWLGGLRSGAQSSGQFYWEDGTQFSYTNWDDTNLAHSGNNCIEMQDEVGFQALSRLGKWVPVSCDKRNLVLCQYPQNWTLTRLQNALIDLKYEFQSLKEHVSEVEKNSSAVPTGFIYTQLANQSEPKTIWPNTDWQDISSEYAGLFFRVVGGESREFGAVQSESSPHLRDVNYKMTDNQPLTTQSPQFTTPSYSNTTTKLISYCFYNSCSGQYNNFLFDFVSGEVTPRNQAMRVWKRIK